MRHIEVTKFIQSINIVDPDTGGIVEIEVHKAPGGGMFAIDASFLDQVEVGGDFGCCYSPFDSEVRLICQESWQYTLLDSLTQPRR